MKKMVDEKPNFMKAVYSYYFPEVRKVVDEVNTNYDHNIFLTSSPVVLDDFHLPVIKKMQRFYREEVNSLDQFKFVYPTSGSSEGIREYLSFLALQGVRQIYTLKGEYEGYRETAKTRGIYTKELTLEELLNAPPSYVMLSNPSARNGNIILNKDVLKMCKQGHKIFYDLAYLGSTQHYCFDLSHKNIVAGCISLSKPLGLFRYRIGFTFGREEIPSLYSNKWFKSIPALLIAEKVFDTMQPDQIWKKYKAWQLGIIQRVNSRFGLDLQPSDAILLAYLPDSDAKTLSKEKKEIIEPYRRGDGFRLCLTPYFEEYEKSLAVRK